MFTGLSDTAFAELVRRTWQLRQDKERGRPWSLCFTDRVLLVVMALRTNLTERQLAWVFGTTDSTVDRVVQDISPYLAALFQGAPADRRYLWVVDGTLVPTEDHTRSAQVEELPAVYECPGRMPPVGPPCRVNRRSVARQPQRRSRLPRDGSKGRCWAPPVDRRRWLQGSCWCHDPNQGPRRAHHRRRRLEALPQAKSCSRTRHRGHENLGHITLLPA